MNKAELKMLKVYLITVCFILNCTACLAFFPSQQWIEDNTEYGTAVEYWTALSPNLSAGSINDNMYDYLKNTLGYSGTLNDMLYEYLLDETGQTGTLNDLMSYYNNNIISSDDFMFVDGNNFFFVDGNNFTFL